MPKIQSLRGNDLTPQVTPERVRPEMKEEPIQAVPFQMVFDEAVDALHGLSHQEMKTNNLTEKFIKGEATVEEVMIETSKLNLAFSMATTVVSTGVQTFKEIQNIPL